MSDEALDLELTTSLRAQGFESMRGARVSTLTRVLLLFLVAALTTAATGCNSDTLFKSNFDANASNQPPAPSQAVGTVAVEGNVVVTTLPDLPSLKGVRLDPAQSSTFNVLTCNLVPHPVDGTYVFSAQLLIPSASGGQLTISFDRTPATVSTGTESKAAAVGPQRFLHLDFLGETVTIDNDPGTTFGKFPRDQLFTVQVTIKLNATPSAYIVLSGAGASGEANRSLQAGTHPVPLSFGGVRISTVLTADEQKFYAANILVTRKS